MNSQLSTLDVASRIRRTADQMLLLCFALDWFRFFFLLASLPSTLSFISISCLGLLLIMICMTNSDHSHRKSIEQNKCILCVAAAFSIFFHFWHFAELCRHYHIRTKYAEPMLLDKTVIIILILASSWRLTLETPHRRKNRSN